MLGWAVVWKGDRLETAQHMLAACLRSTHTTVQRRTTSQVQAKTLHPIQLRSRADQLSTCFSSHEFCRAAVHRAPDQACTRCGPALRHQEGLKVPPRLQAICSPWSSSYHEETQGCSTPTGLLLNCPGAEAISCPKRTAHAAARRILQAFAHARSSRNAQRSGNEARLGARCVGCVYQEPL